MDKAVEAVKEKKTLRGTVGTLSNKLHISANKPYILLEHL